MSSAFTELETLWHEHHFAMLRHARIQVGTDAADDLVQDVFCNALKAMLGSSVTIDNPRAWLYRILRNRIIDHFRANKRHPQWVAIDDLIGDEDDPPGKTEADRMAKTMLTPFEVVEQQDVVKRVRRAVDRLPERQAYAIQMRLDGWNTPEVGRIMEISEGAAKQLNTRAYVSLREQLSEAA